MHISDFQTVETTLGNSGGLKKADYENHFRKKEFQKRILLGWCLIFAGVLLLLPIGAVLDENGNLAAWFIIYVASGASLLSLIAVMIKIQKPSPKSTGAVYLTDGGFAEDELEGLEEEDRELLRSLRELREWYMESLAKTPHSQMFANALEKWYRLGIAKEIEVRNLKKIAKRCKIKPERVRAQ